jgi:hypothetical protein
MIAKSIYDVINSVCPDDSFKPINDFRGIDNFFLLQAINLDKNLGAGSHRLITIILSYADSNTGKRSFPGMKTIATLMHCTKRNVYQMFKHPNVRRWIRRVKNEFVFNFALARAVNKALNDEKSLLTKSGKTKQDTVVETNNNPAPPIVPESDDDDEDLAQFQALALRGARVRM